MARGIGEGDKVRIFMNSSSRMWQMTTEEIWLVTYTPCDVGDTWTFERDGQIIKINPNSANFDGLELAERGAT